MSRTFYIVPDTLPSETPGISLGMASRLARRFTGEDEEALHGMTLDAGDSSAVAWLEGVAEADSPYSIDARTLLAELAKHRRIRIEVER